MRALHIRWLAPLLSLVALAPTARGDAPDPDAARIAAAGQTLKWNWTPPGRSDRFGHAETLIHAPLANVRKLVLDFGHYTALAPSISTSRIVGREAGATDVYLRIGVMNNVLTLWSVIRFAPLRITPSGDEVIEGQMVPDKGNITAAVLVWTLHPVDPEWTVLKFDMLLRPGVLAPQSLVDDQLRGSAMDAVNSIHDRAQGSAAIIPYPGPAAPSSN
ncbi:MAG: hypothetical protein ABW133_00490 [Polyangiaceae bacterium]